MYKELKNLIECIFTYKKNILYQLYEDNNKYFLKNE